MKEGFEKKMKYEEQEEEEEERVMTQDEEGKGGCMDTRKNV